MLNYKLKYNLVFGNLWINIHTVTENKIIILLSVEEEFQITKCKFLKQITLVNTVVSQLSYRMGDLSSY